MEPFQKIPKLASFLWFEPHIQKRSTLEVVTATSYLDLDIDRTEERAALALMEKSTREGSSIQPHALNIPFYRLSSKERFVLWALHEAHWTYERLARALGETKHTIAESVFKCRLYLATLAGSKQTLALAPITQGTHCPEYSHKDPWTQRFMDDELSHNQKLFLQTHLMACDSCRYTLHQFRELYYNVEKLMPKENAQTTLYGKDLETIYWKAQRLINPRLGISFLMSIKIFFQRTWLKWTTVLSLFLLLKIYFN